MITAIMQPYFFPYIGYFQLMQAVDTFVFYDDVQYMQRGWVNRNRIRRPGNTSTWLTLPVCKESRATPINQRQYLLAERASVERAERLLEESYGKAQYRDEAMPIVSGLLKFERPNVAEFNANLLEAIARRLGMGCRFIAASQLGAQATERGEDRIIALCRRLGTTHYINPIGGVSLYDAARFRSSGMQLSFLRTSTPPRQLANGPEHLSIIDMLMHDGIQGCASRLDEYELIPPDATHG